MKILVADDDAVSRVMLEDVLNEMGHETVSVENGDKAWLALTTNPDIRMVLLDWMMPGISGLDITYKVREDLTLRDRYVYVIMISQRDTTDDLVKAIEAGADDYIAKPVDVNELRVRIAAGIRILDLHYQLRAAKSDQEKLNEALRMANDELEDRVARRTSELTDASRKLRVSEENFRAIFESAEDWMFVKDADLRITHVNPALLTSYGLDRDRVIGMTLKEFWESDEAEALEEVDSRVLAGNVIKHQYKTLVQGQAILAEFVRVPLRDASHKVIGICGIGRNVTDRVQRLPEADLDDSGLVWERYPALVTRRTLEQIDLAAKTDSIVLLLGESGVGKDFLARQIHKRSRRAKGPFIAVNCAALPTELIEAELFGHEAGAFTGALGKKRGFFELAEGGTLLLNEIGELTPHAQAKLLMFLDTRTFTRVGGRSPVHVNAKILAATNRNLRKEVGEGRFRKDLLYRLDVFTVHVPPLRDRIEDLPVLVKELLQELARGIGLQQAPVVQDSVMEALSRYHWPGNVRELKNILERTLILCNGRDIGRDQVETLATVEKLPQRAGIEFQETTSNSLLLDDAFERVKRSFVAEALKRSGGNIKEAAELLGIARNTLYHYMKSLGFRE